MICIPPFNERVPLERPSPVLPPKQENMKETTMSRRVRPNQTDLRKRVLGIVRKQKMCDLDELILECTSYNWTNVFLEVDRLNEVVNCVYFTGRRVSILSHFHGRSSQ